MYNHYFTGFVGQNNYAQDSGGSRAWAKWGKGASFFVYVHLLAFLPSVISFFLTQIRGEAWPHGPSPRSTTARDENLAFQFNCELCIVTS